MVQLMIKRLLKISIKMILILILIAVIINIFVIAYSSPYIYDISDIQNIETYTASMALGAKVYSNGNLSYVLRDRIDHAIMLYDIGKAQKIIFSGDHGQKTYDEVNAMLTYARDKGINSRDIFLDHAGFSTYESMYRAKEIFLVNDLIIVTQKFHIYRSVYIARRLGIRAIGVTSNQHNYYLSTHIKNNLRESLARIKDFIFIEITKPKPTYLGEIIPIIGDGRLTHD